MTRRAVAVIDATGLVAGVVALAGLHATRLAPVPYPLVGSFQLTWSLVLAGLLLVTGYTIGLPELPRNRTEVVLSSAGVVSASLLAVSVSQLALGSQLLPRSVLLLVAVLHPVWALLVWNLARDVDHHQASRDRVLVVAEHGDEVAALHLDLASRPERTATVVGHLRPTDMDRGDVNSSVLVDTAVDLGATVVVLDAAAQDDPRIVSQMTVLHGRGIRFRPMSLFYSEWLGKLPLSELERVSLLFDIGELHRARYQRGKRVVDVVAGCVGVAAIIPVGAAVCVANLAGNRGPLLFRQVRVGKGGQAFEMLKFRTMSPTAGDHCTWTGEDDPRITRFGRILRRTHLDELPQALNILRGELSLVGPRPEQVHYVEELRAKLPFYDARHLVRPGLTGWAQVKYGYAGSDADALEKLQYDLFYLRRQGFRFDLRITVRTLRHLTGTGAR